MITDYYIIVGRFQVSLYQSGSWRVSLSCSVCMEVVLLSNYASYHPMIQIWT